MKIVEFNYCTIEGCDCGWNIVIGGTDKKELQKVKKFLEELNQHKNEV